MASQHHTVEGAACAVAIRALRFVPRTSSLKSLAFPCDAAGRVDIDSLGEQERNAYLFARALMGRDYAFPVISTLEAARTLAGLSA